jgi:tetratricopeptide (TPR) repeat protein
VTVPPSEKDPKEPGDEAAAEEAPAPRGADSGEAAGEAFEEPAGEAAIKGYEETAAEIAIVPVGGVDKQALALEATTPAAHLPVDALTAPNPGEIIVNTLDPRVAVAQLPPPVYSPPPPPPPPIKHNIFERAARFARDYFTAYDPTFWSALAPFVLLSIILFARSPATNFIFDEQEALLANPYVNATGGLRFIDAIHRDFWGLPPDRSVGSYRPLPNFLWRLLWNVSKQPFFHSIYNVIFHAVNGAILTCIAFALSRRRGMSYVAGAVFVACAVLTEAVSGIVGIADVLGGMGALLAIGSILLPAWAMPFGVFASVALGLFAKESALVCVPLIPFAALVAAPLAHPERPQRVLRALLALVASAGAFIIYVELRKRWFPSPLPAELEEALPLEAPWTKRAAHDFLVWFHQAPLPKDPLNNPLATAETKLRIAGALRVYFRGLTQVVFPKTLSGDYSFPQEPAPTTAVFPESVAGAALMALPPLASVGMWILAMVRERRARAQNKEQVARAQPRTGLRVAGLLTVLFACLLVAADVLFLRRRGIYVTFKSLPFSLSAIPIALLGLGLVAEAAAPRPRPDPPKAPVPLGRAGLILAAIGLVWVVVSYFPHSNIPIPLPTVRAERFWYFPAIGTSLVIAAAFAWLHDYIRKLGAPWAVPALFAAFLGFQCVQAYRHAMDYRSDLDFWGATKLAVPNSAKAHLNYSVMVGARGQMETRLAESKAAIELAPEWAMAHVYAGDTLCRMHRPDEAWPYYKTGFALGPNELSLIALALQCLYDEKRLTTYEAELRGLAEEHPDTWLSYLALDTLKEGEKHKGVDPKYRPRGYNEGPKE